MTDTGMIDIVAGLLALALILYFVLGGADFGAGIVELAGGHEFRTKHRTLINRAMGPVWEANHVWLILAIVILFTAFPPIFRQVSITYHVPMTLLLLGITIRGCAFSFRHYDAVKDSSQQTYNMFFMASSCVTPLFLGMIAGSMVSGFAVTSPASWYATYMAPWLNWYAFTVGLFTISLFGYVASVFLAGEADAGSRRDFERMVIAFAASSVAVGILVFGIATLMDLSLLADFARSPVSVVSAGIATALFFPLPSFVRKHQVWRSRLTVSTQVTAVLIGWLAISFPAILVTDTGALTVYSASAPPATFRVLLIALGVGALLIFPALGYLLYVFKTASRMAVHRR